MSETTKTYTDAELRYAATARCPCGAGLAYPKGSGMHGAWDCADILTGRAIPSGQPGAKEHTAALPFAFYEVKSEDQPSANGATTRPPETDEQRKARADADEVRVLRAIAANLHERRRDLTRELTAFDHRCVDAYNAGQLTAELYHEIRNEAAS